MRALHSLFKRCELRHHRFVRICEHSLDLQDAEGTSRGVVQGVLDVDHVNRFVLRLLLLTQVEELLAVHPQGLGVKEVAEESEELRQVLAEGALRVDTEFLEEAARHQHDRVRVESARIRLVERVLRKQLFHNQHD